MVTYIPILSIIFTILYFFLKKPSIRAMPQENLPLELYMKHREELGFTNPTVFESENDLFDKKPDSVSSTLVFLPKSKALIDMTLALVSGIVKENGTIILAGTNDAGIRSAKDAYEKNIGPVDQKIVGKHSALYVGKNKKLGIPAHAGAGKKIEDYLSYSPLAFKDTPIEIANLPGVFSTGELDAGTKLLLEHIPFNKNKVLDIGCGTGVIGALYKKKNPTSEITLCDASKLAVLASQKTFEKNNLNGTILESDVFSKITGTFDLIVSNPPFHKGITTDYTFIESFARDAKKHLAKSGEIYIVANSFLAYEKILGKHVGPTETIVDNGKFKILRVKSL